MSTVPGNDAWRDAGLDQQDEPVSLTEEATTDAPEAIDVDDPAHEADEYRPRTSRPDLAGEANEADVVEQASTVPGEEDEYV